MQKSLTMFPISHSLVEAPVTHERESWRFSVHVCLELASTCLKNVKKPLFLQTNFLRPKAVF